MEGIRLVADLTTSLDTPENDIEDVIMSNLPPLAGESQGDITIALIIRKPERLKGLPELIPTLTSKP